uniref:Maturation n=1 Tax=Leviviridae sp. TaxID=2027243 RepID=A0A514D556_9VIRU|nr:MAG: hypothetical protein H1BulkLitter6286_000004 [Leviviridae sp.]
MSRHGYPKSDFSTEHCTGQWTLGGSVVDHYDFTSSYQSFAADKVGANSVGYPAHKENTVYTAFEVKTRNSPAHWSGNTIYGWQGAGTWPISSISGVADPSALVTDINGQAQDEAKQKMINQLISNVKDQKVNVGNFAAEFKQTCGTVTDAASRIASAIRAVKHGDLRRAASTLVSGRHGNEGNQNHTRRTTRRRRYLSTGSAADDWLQLKYGWMPLLSDVNGACEELARTLTYRPDIRKVSAQAKVQREKSLSFPKYATTWPTCSGKGSVEITCKGVVEYQVASRVTSFLANTGLINPLEVAWEVIPYSFVVDWFLPVGSFLNNLDYDTGLVFLRGWITFHGSSRVEIRTDNGGGFDGVTSQTWSGGSIQSDARGYHRDPLGGFPAVPSPSLKDPISLAHVENALALLRQVVGR